ncbi:putative tRNA-splicing endonuclease subunit tsp-4 [Cyphellophora attinorum]|uniref:tRNA-splicing endonuclease subunit Sen34 n=1 Tax=Cyphellophora attinorum TaxID=1664694 RepID=A0A0N0NKR9_9EURO|nr:putative tRNA-splicing endonuclease subunit tsp-4 [Phialophora attinorum]KPI38471.1 putative tRNA-splicing endonuclease subunit tsp-4 [Phialophora attinorum]
MDHTSADSQSGNSRKVPELPIAISMIAGRYMLFDIEAGIYLRREHNICGYNVGTLAQMPSQNGFLGLPILLMPEEAQVLVDKGVGCIVDDKAAHRSALDHRDEARVAEYRAEVVRHATKLQAVKEQYRAETKKRHQVQRNAQRSGTDSNLGSETDLMFFDDDDTVAEDSASKMTQKNPVQFSEQSDRITPTTSGPLLDHASHIAGSSGRPIENLPPNYPLFRHLHNKKYFMTPGLRFGCQYTTYPGDPLRFHSHFLTTDLGWEKGMDLMELVGGGRLGTGVKKGFLIGSHATSQDTHTEALTDEAKIRTFSIEWAVM